MMRRLSINNNQLQNSDSRDAVFKQFYLMGYSNKQLQPLAGYCRNSNYNRDIGRCKAGRSRFDGRALWERLVAESFKSIPNVKTLMEQLLEKFSNSMDLKQFRKMFYSVLENELAPGKYWPQQLLDLVDNLLADPSEASFLLAHLVARAIWDLEYENVPLLEVQEDQFQKALEVINQTGTENQQFQPQDVFKNLHSINIFNKFFGQRQQQEQQQQQQEQQEQEQRQEQQQQQEQQLFIEQCILDVESTVAELEEELRTKINNITTEMSLASAFKELDRSRNETLEFYFATKRMIFATDSLLETINISKEALFNVSAAKSLTTYVTTTKLLLGILALESKLWIKNGEVRVNDKKVKDLCTENNLDACCMTENPEKSAKKFAKDFGAAKSNLATCEYATCSKPKAISGNHCTMVYCPSEKLVENENFTNVTFEIPKYTTQQKSNPQIPMIRVTGLLKSKFSGRLEAFAVDLYGRKTAGKGGLKPEESYTHHINAHDACVQDNNNNRRGHPFVEFGDTNSDKLKDKLQDLVEKYGEGCVVCNRDGSDLRCFFLATNGTVTVNFYGFNLTFALMPVKNTFDGIGVPPEIKTNHRHVAVAEVHYVLIEDEEAKRFEAAEKRFAKIGE